MLSILLSFCLLLANANEDWVTFRSDLGYEIDHPKCWEIKYDSPGAKGDFKKISDLFIKEGKICQITSKHKYIENGIAISVITLKGNERKEYIEKLIKRGKFETEISKKWLFFRKPKFSITILPTNLLKPTEESMQI